MLRTGTRAPDIESVDHRGVAVSLRALVRNGPVVVYFYPRDMTLGCTIEACSFRDAYPELTAFGCQVIGVSYDSLERHREFAAANNLPFGLVSDEDKALAHAYDVTGFFDLFPKRVTYVVDSAMTIIGVFHHELSMKAHVANVKTALKALPVGGQRHP